jgi:PhnB protein
MASRLNPYLSFDGNAREAMQFYGEVFGAEPTFSTFGDFGDPSAPGATNIMHAMLETPDGFTLMAADNPPGAPYTPGTTMSISLSGDDDQALRGYWEKLADGGVVSVPLEKQMWGDVFGMCTDRFGVTWMVNIMQPQAS